MPRHTQTYWQSVNRSTQARPYMFQSIRTRDVYVQTDTKSLCDQATNTTPISHLPKLPKPMTSESESGEDTDDDDSSSGSSCDHDSDPDLEMEDGDDESDNSDSEE